jgi:hypothetical protein
MTNNRKLLLGAVITILGVAFIFSMIPTVVTSASSSSPHLALKYRSVSDTGDCLVYGMGAPCTECKIIGLSGSVNAICTDVLTAVGAKQTWHAYYYSSSGPRGVNLGETSGILYAGQTLTFIFGLAGPCVYHYVPLIVKIVGPYNTVEIGYSGCG